MTTTETPKHEIIRHLPANEHRWGGFVARLIDEAARVDGVEPGHLIYAYTIVTYSGVAVFLYANDPGDEPRYEDAISQVDLDYFGNALQARLWRPSDNTHSTDETNVKVPLVEDMGVEREINYILLRLRAYHEAGGILVDEPDYDLANRVYSSETDPCSDTSEPSDAAIGAALNELGIPGFAQYA